MEITYDQKADAMYIKFRSGDFAKNKLIDRNTIIDLDKKGNILGIEILSVSKRIPKESFSEITFRNVVKIK